jgi:hypothetical protein
MANTKTSLCRVRYPNALSPPRKKNTNGDTKTQKPEAIGRPSLYLLAPAGSRLRCSSGLPQPKSVSGRTPCDMMRERLQQCEENGHAFYSDGVHLNKADIKDACASTTDIMRPYRLGILATDSQLVRGDKDADDWDSADVAKKEVPSTRCHPGAGVGRGPLPLQSTQKSSGAPYSTRGASAPLRRSSACPRRETIFESSPPWSA